MSISNLLRKKQKPEKITMLTCYDYPSARTLAQTEVDIAFVGDSVATAVHGHINTTMATIDMMVMHTQAVARGLGKQLLLVDLPFLCHRQSQAQTISYVSRLIQAGAQAIKIEGGDQDTCNTIAYLVTSGIPIFGHIGLTPQFVYQLGGYKIQGRDENQAAELLSQAQCLQEAGCSAIVIECVPEHLAKKITESLKIPTIGIGAGSHTDGQVLVWHDLLGLHDFKPKFLKQYAQSAELIISAINHFVEEVKSVSFPSSEHAFA